MARLRHGKQFEVEGWGRDQADLPPFDDGRLDPRTWFSAPERSLEIEIGTGKGTFLVQQAKLQPETNFLGIEWSREYYGYAADRVRRHGLDQVRMLRADATEFLRYWCEGNIADIIHVYFSDPWPKSRHHKRRVIQDRTLTEFHRVLRPGGEVRLVTDHADLWAWYEEHAEQASDRFERCAFTAPQSAGEGEVVGTNYERKFAIEGRSFNGMVLRRK